MSPAVRRGGQCAFCVFRLSEPGVAGAGRRDGVKRFGTSTSRQDEDTIIRIQRVKPGFSLLLERNPHEAMKHISKVRSRRSGAKKSPYGVLGQLLLDQTHSLERSLMFKDQEYGPWGIKNRMHLAEKMQEFRMTLQSCTDMAEAGAVSKDNNYLFFRLRNAFVNGDLTHLAQEMKFAFITWTVGARFQSQDTASQKKLADLRYPFEWYAATRAIKRTIHLHVGPTNSGKTYHALQKLEAAATGVYAGPLRLLAHEIYTRLNAKGRKCALITGEERRLPEDMDHVMNSCTVEMVPLNMRVDVAVIDEIQMIADAERGWAWTQAFLGVQAKEVHLCGELRTVELISALCAANQEELVIHRYERLSPLEAESDSLNGDLKKLQKGDAIILFSRVAIHAMKKDVEKATGKRCAVVYGGLPPETRAQQAALFNDPDNDYDYLVASDAVGMGLNLSIKRIIFESTSKHDGIAHRIIQPSELKQIAGRAGRYKTAHEVIQKISMDSAEEATSLQPRNLTLPNLVLQVMKKPSRNIGYVTSLEKFDLPIVKKAMATEVGPITSAGIFPPASVLINFSRYFPPETPFSYIVLRLHEMAALDTKFHICRLKEQLEISDTIQSYPLSIVDRLIFMSAPASMRDPGYKHVMKELAGCVANKNTSDLLDMKSMNLELLEMDIHSHQAGSMGYLREAESLHKQVTLYLWLSYRFAGVFRSQALAFHVKSLIEKKIDECLQDVHWDSQKRKHAAEMRRKAFIEQQRIHEEARLAAVEEETREGGSPDANGLLENLAAISDYVDEHLETAVVDSTALGGNVEELEQTIGAHSNIEGPETTDDLVDIPAAEHYAPIPPPISREQVKSANV